MDRIIVEKKPIDIVSEPERIKVLLDQTRRHILQIMGTSKLYDMNVTELAELLHSAPQRLYHHVDKLVESNFLVKTREERKIRSVVSYYSRTSDMIIINYNIEDQFHEQDLIINEISQTLISVLQLNLQENVKNKLKEFVKELIAKLSFGFNGKSRCISLSDLDFLIEYYLHYTNPEVKSTLNDIKSLVDNAFQQVN